MLRALLRAPAPSRLRTTAVRLFASGNVPLHGGGTFLPRKDGILRAKHWDDMPAVVQAHWKMLGWTPSHWRGFGDSVPTSRLDFKDLTKEQQQSAAALGYTSETWDAEEEEDVFTMDALDIHDQPWLQIGPMKRATWRQLMAEQQRHWQVLGWTQIVWDADGNLPPPPSSYKEWSDLTAAERLAAEALGYDLHGWNNDNDFSPGAARRDDDAYWRTSRGQFVASAYSQTGLPPDIITGILRLAYLATGLATAMGLVVGGGWLDAQRRRREADAAESGATTHLVRHAEVPRSDWRERVKACGLSFAELPGVCWARSFYSEYLLSDVWLRRLGLDEPYWNERASYKLSDEGAWRIERACFELHSLLE